MRSWPKMALVENTSLYNHGAEKEITHLSKSEIIDVGHSIDSIASVKYSSGLTETQIRKCQELVRSQPDEYPAPVKPIYRTLTVLEWIDELREDRRGRREHAV